MTILICGASGIVGIELCKLLDIKKIKYYGTYNKNKLNEDNMFKLNFFDINDIENFLLNKQISICIYLIAERLPDVCEKEWDFTKKINIELVNNTSFICQKLNIKFIHLSTDYVFDGTKQPNYPNDLKNPLQNYGISKLLSEFKVMSNCSNYCLIRIPALYSSSSKLHNNVVTILGKNIMNLTQDIHKEDNYNIRRPVYIKDLCHFILDCCYKNNGIFHFYNPLNKFTKYDITKLIGNYLNLDTSHIMSINEIKDIIALRPYDTQLIDNRYNINDYNFTDFNNSIEECFYKFKISPIKDDNVKDFIFFIDLDETLIQSGKAHYDSYINVFKKHNIKTLEYQKWKEILNNGNINNYLESIILNTEKLKQIKREKIEELKTKSIVFTKNSDKFITYLISNSINFCIVTNTNIDTVNIFKQKLPLLNKIKNWICRDDYNFSKPSPDCYYTAKNKYYNNEKYIIGIEDSFVGYNSLKHITDKIFIFNNEELFKNNDCYLFDNFEQLILQFQ